MFADGIESESSIYSSTEEWSQPCRRFKFAEIRKATENFKESLVVGRGGFGTVYKGNIVIGSSTRVVAAIKRIVSTSYQGLLEFSAEVETLSKLHHPHIVSLIGYCDYKKEKIVVYEYIHNGSLYEHLHSFHTLLSWIQRLKICIDVARGLDNLHTGTGREFSIIHGDVKSSNIFLTKSWAAKIGDFGLSKIVESEQTILDITVAGTLGYLDPNYMWSGTLSKKSDVYSFGVVLLEVLCRKKARDGTMIDPDIRDEISAECLKGFVQITERCLDDSPEHRPTMSEVVFVLESILKLQERSNNLLHARRKREFYTTVDRFSMIPTEKHSGLEFGFCIPEKKKLLMLREKILRQSGAMSFLDFSMKFFQLKTNFFGSIKLFEAKELETSTNNYAQDRILGRGAQGIVYMGILPDKRVVAIKRHRILSQSRLEQLITEIVILEQINHDNMVRLLGCCFETEGALLVYEFASNGTLHHHIHNKSSGNRRLSWDSRLRIAHESANAFDYLHEYAKVSIIHRDVKSANILLDENFTAKISDFGSLKLIPMNRGQVNAHVEGTLGYIDPEYFCTHQVTSKTDVYGFGVILTELLTGKKPFDRERNEDDRRLSTYFMKEVKDDRLRKIIDPQILEEATDEQLSATCDLVHRCLEPLGANRPSMNEVTMELERIRKLGEHRCVNQDK